MICGHGDGPDPACRFCRLAAKDPRYAASFRAVPAAAGPVKGSIRRPPGRTRPACLHLGTVVEFGHGCCGGRGDVYDCGRHERCVLVRVPGKTRPGVACCEDCPDHAPPG